MAARGPAIGLGLRQAAYDIMGAAEEYGKLDVARNRAIQEAAWNTRVQERFVGAIEDIKSTPYMTDENDENGLVNDAGEDLGAKRITSVRDELLAEANRTEDPVLQAKKIQVLAAYYLHHQSEYTKIRDAKYKSAAGETFVNLLNDQMPALVNGSPQEREAAKRMIEAQKDEYVSTGVLDGAHAATIVKEWEETGEITRYKKLIDAGMTYEKIVNNPKEIPFIADIDKFNISEEHKIELRNYAIQAAHRVITMKDMAENEIERELRKTSRNNLRNGLDLADRGRLTDRASVMEYVRSTGLNSWTPDDIENLVNYVQGGGAMDWVAVADYMKAPSVSRINALHNAGKVTNQFWLTERRHLEEKGEAEKFNLYRDPVMMNYNAQIQGYVQANSMDSSTHIRGAKAWADFVGMVRDPKFAADKEGALYQSLYQNGFIRGTASLPPLPPDLAYKEDENPMGSYLRAKKQHETGAINDSTWKTLLTNYRWRLHFWQLREEQEKLKKASENNQKKIRSGIGTIEGIPNIP